MPKKFAGESGKGIYNLINAVTIECKNYEAHTLTVSAAERRKAKSAAEVEEKKRQEYEKKQSAYWNEGSKDASKKETEESKRVSTRMPYRTVLLVPISLTMTALL